MSHTDRRFFPNMHRMVITEEILSQVQYIARTTDAIALAVDAEESDVRELLVALARQGRVNLVSHGWNMRYCWSCIPLDEFPEIDRHDPAPWEMNDRDRYESLAAGCPA